MKRALGIAGALCAGLTYWSACSRAPEPLLPDLEGAEDAVVEKIRRLHTVVLEDPRAASWGHYAKTLHAHDFRDEALHAYAVAAEYAASPAERFESLYLAGYIETRMSSQKARELFEQALDLRREYEPLHLRLGELFEDERRFDEAQTRYQSARRIRRSTHALFGLGRVALEQGRVEDAIEYLEAAVRLDASHGGIYASLAPAYARAGRMEDAARAASAAGDLVGGHGFPDPIVVSMAEEGVSYRARVDLAIANLNRGTPDAALPHIDEALRLRPNAVDALFHKGRTLASLERFEEAAHFFDRVLGIQPQNIECLAMQAACLMKLGRPDEALALLSRALEIDPYNVKSHFSLGALLRKSDPETAKEHLTFVLERMPHRVDARIILAAILVEEERAPEAERELSLVLEQDPRNVVALSLLESLERK